MTTGKSILAAAAAVTLIGFGANQGGAHLRLALEDRADPHPRRMAVGMQLAGMCVGLAISWSEHAPRS